MKETIKKIHLYSGLGLMAFVAMYFITGFVMIKHDWFPSKDPDKSTRVEQVQIPAGLDLDQAGEWIADKFDLGGKPQPVQTVDDGRVRYRFFRPGVNLVAHLAADKASVEIERTQLDFSRLMVGYHRMRGYSGNIVWLLWGLMYDLASLGCIVFALSGVWVWATARERDKVSWVMLVTGVGFTLAMILYLMLTK
ncbi:MAG: hypothetical protein FVQ81_08710 [Candidatus Glassbacteria bacterium]|nr:hypothetical protein [Candidatus Glassbacteria bacterium]